ncbi:MAG: PIG-L family deacetylase [Planctomycetes bacterium]|nr:PIG-L family deacetylase [Planctomycetota bacterium]
MGAADGIRVLALMAHPDDAEFLCAGTLIQLREAGAQIVIATVADGCCGSLTSPPEEIRAIRAEEARRAAARIDAPYECCGRPDIEVFFDDPTRRWACDLVRRHRPDLVFAHHPDDYMFDHIVASQLARDAAFNASIPNYRTASPPTEGIPHLYYCDAIEGCDHFGIRIRVALYVDITSALETKVKMLCEHASQREWLMAQHGMDRYIETMRAWAARRGSESGVPAAEAFSRHLGHAYPKDDILARLLPGAVREAPA